MNPGSVFFDEEFYFHDGASSEKLFIVLGNHDDASVVAKTTSKQHGRGTIYGCQPSDRFHNFYLPPGSSYLRVNTWVCLDEFYELKAKDVLSKRFSGKIKPVCVIENDKLRLIQDCALQSLDISPKQAAAITSCLA